MVAAAAGAAVSWCSWCTGERFSWIKFYAYERLLNGEMIGKAFFSSCLSWFVVFFLSSARCRMRQESVPIDGTLRGL